LTLMVSEARKKQGAGRLASVFNTACHTPISLPVPVPTGHRDGPGFAPGRGRAGPGRGRPVSLPAPRGRSQFAFYLPVINFRSPRGDARAGGRSRLRLPMNSHRGVRAPETLLTKASQDGPMITAGGPGGRDFGPNRPFKLPGPSPGRRPYVRVTFPQRLPVRSGNTVTAHGRGEIGNKRPSAGGLVLVPAAHSP
jgi:hypothetical protein